MVARNELAGLLQEEVDFLGALLRVVHVGGETRFRLLEQFIVDVKVLTWNDKKRLVIS